MKYYYLSNHCSILVQKKKKKTTEKHELEVFHRIRQVSDMSQSRRILACVNQIDPAPCKGVGCGHRSVGCDNHGYRSPSLS